MLPLAKNPVTGFLESSKGSSFDSIRKTRFLEIAREAADRKEMPDIPAICKVIGISTHAFWDHKRIDEVFKAQWEEILDTCETTLVSTMYANGQRPSGYMDRITWLRAYRPGTWHPDLKVSISSDLSNLKSVIDTSLVANDADIVEDPPQIEGK